MLIAIPDILTPAERAAMRDAIGSIAWTDGATTARGAARAVKHNEQADPSDPTVRGLLEMARTRLHDNAVFRAAARPARFARLILSRYGPGMAYGQHVDAPYIDGVRTDVSFTLFLSEPADYAGGALVIDGEEPQRLPAGTCIVYPADRLHAVSPVTEGTRYAIVGWVRSQIAQSADRALLFELDAALADLGKTNTPRAVHDRLNNLRNNLVRRFGD